MAETMHNLIQFGLYFSLGLGLIGLYLVVYLFVTAHNELALIRQNVMAAALALGLSLIGFALPLSSAVVHAKWISDCLLWGLVAMLVQLLAYGAVRLVLPDLSRRIAVGEISAALFLGAASVTAGLVNAAAMTF
jgi:putative membrane protein